MSSVIFVKSGLESLNSQDTKIVVFIPIIYIQTEIGNEVD